MPVFISALSACTYSQEFIVARPLNEHDRDYKFEEIKSLPRAQSYFVKVHDQGLELEVTTNSKLEVQEVIRAIGVVPVLPVKISESDGMENGALQIAVAISAPLAGRQFRVGTGSIIFSDSRRVAPVEVSQIDGPCMVGWKGLPFVPESSGLMDIPVVTFDAAHKIAQRPLCFSFRYSIAVDPRNAFDLELGEVTGGDNTPVRLRFRPAFREVR